MVSLTAKASEFSGLIPAIDSRRLNKPHIVRGRNVLLDGDGPKSYFGSEFFSYENIRKSKFAKTVRIGSRAFILAAEGIFEYDTEALVFDLIYEYPSNVATAFPWTTAFVGNEYFFCHEEIGIIRYNVNAETFNLFSGGLVPVKVKGICQAYGRLVILSDEVVQWSALDVGTDLTPSLATGAGAQALSFIGGTGIRAEAVEDGFLVFTTRGIMKMQFAANAAVFVPRMVSQNQILLTPNALVRVDPQGLIFLTRTGFYQTSGQFPVPYAPLMSEYFRRDVITQFDTSIVDIFRLDYSEDLQILFVSIASEGDPNVFQKTFANYLPTQDKWGTFDEKHVGFVDVFVPQGPFKGFNFGYICPAGYVHLFADHPFFEVICGAENRYDLLWIAPDELRGRINDNVYIGSTLSVSWGSDPVAYKGLKTGQYVTGLYSFLEASSVEYEIDPPTFVLAGVSTASTLADTGSLLVDMRASAYGKTLAPLNSFIEIGLYQFEEQREADEESAITSLIIGTSPVGDSSNGEDWNSDFLPEEDWNTLATVFEDWGYNIPTGTDYTTTLISTNDGIQLTDFGEEFLEPTIKNEVSIQFDPRGISAQYHSIKMSASVVGNSFHLKLLKVAGMLTGRSQG